jgi:hypothetical protein
MAPPKPKTKKQRMKDLERSLNPDGDLSPKAVMALQMQFFNSEAEQLTQDLIAALKKQNVRAETLLGLYREMLQHRKDYADIAQKLAKFVHPAMESVSVKQETTHKFVVVAPPIIEDAQAWLDKCNADIRSRAIKQDLDIDRMLTDAKKTSGLKPIEDTADENPLDDKHD